PASSDLSGLPSSFMEIAERPTSPWSVSPVEIAAGASPARCGSVVIAPNCLQYFASWTSWRRSISELQTGSRMFRVAAGSIAPTAFGGACAYGTHTAHGAWEPL